MLRKVLSRVNTSVELCRSAEPKLLAEPVERRGSLSGAYEVVGLYDLRRWRGVGCVASFVASSESRQIAPRFVEEDMVKLVLLAGLLVLIAMLAAPRRVPSMMGDVRGESAGAIGSPQHDYLRLQDELIAKP